MPTLLNAWRMIGNETDCKLLLIGDGDKRSEYESLAFGLNVEFMGKQSNDVVREMMARAMAVVLPSECWEGMPITVLESFAEGTPCIVSDLGALPEYIRSGELGETFEMGSAESLAAAIKRLLSRPDYDEICVAAKREAEGKYSEEANYRQLADIYGEVVSG